MTQQEYLEQAADLILSESQPIDQAALEDVYALPDAYIVSWDEWEPIEQSQLDRAGIDPMTPVDGFIAMNGDTAFITETDL